MKFLGRSSELGALRGVLDSRTPSITVVSGVRGGGKSALVRRVLQDYPHLVHVCAPLPEPAQRARLARRLSGVWGGVASNGRSPEDGAPSDAGSIPNPADALSADSGWPRLFDAAVAKAASADRPSVLVLDDAHRLLESRARFLGPLLQALAAGRGEGIPLHVVLVGSHDVVGKVEDAIGTDEDAPAFSEIRVPPLRFRSAAPLLPGRSPDDRLRAYGVFGGLPSVLQHVDPSVGVGTNVRRLQLAGAGPLSDAGGLWLERDLQTPARYYAILATLSRGEADWGKVHEGVPDLTRSGQVAPYLKKLMDLGLIEVRRSVDATPGGRARRYAITDPFFAFWFRFILPLRLGTVGDPWAGPGKPRTGPGNPWAGPGDPWTRPGDPRRESGDGDAYAREIRPRLDHHLESVLPMVCRQHMSRDAVETLGAVSREGGSLWGPDYDLPVAGILTNGAAYFGACQWLPGRPDRKAPLEHIEADMRASRYGFGRERRLRLVFTGRPPSIELVRRIARDPDARLIDAEALMG